MTRAWPLVLATVLPLGALGCDDPPTCGVQVTISGAINGEVPWDLSGAEYCGMADASTIADEASALVFVARDGENYQEFIVIAESPVLGVANFPGQVLFVTPDNIWDSGPSACDVVITNYTHEDWSRTDFVEFEGVVDCPGPLVSAGGGENLTMTTMGIRGHVYDELLSFENI
jgi:hypothetical protein